MSILINNNFGQVNHIENSVVNINPQGKTGILPKTKDKAAPQTKRESAPFEPDYMTFTNKRADKYNLVLLYQDLLKANWIDEGNPDYFGALFSGQLSMDKITWIGKGTDNLYALFRMMVEEQFVEVPQGHGVERIVRSHFINKEGKHIAGDSYKPSVNAKTLIDSWKKDLIAKPKNFDE